MDFSNLIPSFGAQGTSMSNSGIVGVGSETQTRHAALESFGKNCQDESPLTPPATPLNACEQSDGEHLRHSLLGGATPRGWITRSFPCTRDESWRSFLDMDADNSKCHTDSPVCGISRYERQHQMRSHDDERGAKRDFRSPFEDDDERTFPTYLVPSTLAPYQVKNCDPNMSIPDDTQSLQTPWVPPDESHLETAKPLSSRPNSCSTAGRTTTSEPPNYSTLLFASESACGSEVSQRQTALTHTPLESWSAPSGVVTQSLGRLGTLSLFTDSDRMKLPPDDVDVCGTIPAAAWDYPASKEKRAPSLSEFPTLLAPVPQVNHPDQALPKLSPFAWKNDTHHVLGGGLGGPTIPPGNKNVLSPWTESDEAYRTSQHNSTFDAPPPLELEQPQPFTSVAEQWRSGADNDLAPSLVSWPCQKVIAVDSSPHYGSKSTTRSSSRAGGHSKSWEGPEGSFPVHLYSNLFQECNMDLCESPALNDTMQMDQGHAPPLVDPVDSDALAELGSNQAVDIEDPELRDIAGSVMRIATLQSGSRYLQRLLSRRQPDVTALILSEVTNNIMDLMMDPYGNYLCQQLFQSCSASQRQTMVRELAPNAATVARDRRGTHSMQALISLLKTPEEESLFMRPLESEILDIAMHPHGTHVVQRALACFSEASLTRVLHMNLEQLATNPHGLCVVKKAISAVSAPNSKFRSLLLDKLSELAVPLVQSPFGNYAIQHAFQEWGPVVCASIVYQVKLHLAELSTQKFSSNVVEKAIETADDVDAHDMIQQLTDPGVMSVLVDSAYGSFVVQKALERATYEETLGLLAALQTTTRGVQGKRLRAKWESTLEAIRSKLNSGGGTETSKSSVYAPHVITGPCPQTNVPWQPFPTHSASQASRQAVADALLLREEVALLRLPLETTSGGGPPSSSMYQPVWLRHTTMDRAGRLRTQDTVVSSKTRPPQSFGPKALRPSRRGKRGKDPRHSRRRSLQPFVHEQQ